MQKKWQSPNLIILTRGTPAEAILTSCKGGDTNQPNGINASCRKDPGCATASCDTVSSS